MNAPASSKPVTVTLDKDRTITYDNRAEFRMGSLDKPFSVSDFRVKKRSWAALVAWIWACLSERDALDFPSPESLSVHFRDEKTTVHAFDKFCETYKAAQEMDSKNSAG